MKTIKRPRHLTQESFDRMKNGRISRFRFGFADVGEKIYSETGDKVSTFRGNFARMMDATAEASKYPNCKAVGYLYGKLSRGWVVITTEQTPAQPAMQNARLALMAA